MAQPPPDQNFYHHTHSHGHQLQLPPQFRNPFDLLFDERTGAINYNYIRPYIPNQIAKSENLTDSLVMRRPRRTRTTFTSAQIAELEQHFLQGRYLTSSRLAELSAKLALGTAQVKIWFKNRRRRHKIQSDQQKENSFSCDGMQLSPLVPNTVRTDHPSNNSSVVPPNFHTMNLGGSGGSTPTTLTPSPTPTTPSATHIDHYGDSYNPYYFSGSATGSQSMSHHGHSGPAHQYPPTNPTATNQFFPPHPSGVHHQHVQMSMQHHQQQYHPHHYEFQSKTCNRIDINVVKDDPDFNFNSPYYMRLPAASTDSSNANNDVIPSPNALSPNSEVYQPLTPKNDESPSVCNRGNGTKAVITGEMDTRSCPKGLNTLMENCSESVNNNRLSTIPISSANHVKDCNGAFSKYNKLSNGESHDSNYQCTMDTIMQAYNTHRNSSGNAQFAYCFN